MEKLEAIKQLFADAMLKALLESDKDNLAQMSWFCTEEQSFLLERREEAA